MLRRSPRFVRLALPAALAPAACSTLLGIYDVSPAREAGDAPDGATLDADAIGGDGETDAPQRVVVLAHDQNKPTGIATYGGDVYWVNAGDGTLNVVRQRVGLPVTLAHSDGGNLSEVVVDPIFVYYGRYVPNGCEGATLFAVKHDGTSNRDITGGCLSLTRFLLHGNDLFATSRNQVVRFYTDGTMRLTLATEPPSGSPVALGAIATDGPNVYFAAPSENRILKVTVGATSSVLFAPNTLANDMLIDGTFLYWLDAGGSVVRLGLGAATENPTVLAMGQDTPTRMASSRGMLYWTNAGSGTIASTPLDGGNPTILADHQNGPAAIAADPFGVYWTNADGTVAMVALP
jgi:hypothetical protein